MDGESHLEDSALAESRLFGLSERTATNGDDGSRFAATGLDLRSTELAAEEDMVMAGAESLFKKIDALAQNNNHQQIGAVRATLAARILRCASNFDLLRHDLLGRLVEGSRIKSERNRRAAAAIFAVDSHRLTYIVFRSALGFRVSRQSRGRIELEGIEQPYRNLALTIGETVMNECRFDLLRRKKTQKPLPARDASRHKAVLTVRLPSTSKSPPIPHGEGAMV